MFMYIRIYIIHTPSKVDLYIFIITDFKHFQCQQYAVETMIKISILKT